MKLLDYLLLGAGFSKNRISFESPVELPRDKTRSRTDLICYDEDFKPLLLVECKAPEVQLDEKVALQISRYNTEVGAPFLLVTNGLRDFWFKAEQGELTYLEEIPEPFAPTVKPERDFGYWSDRGFAGAKSHQEIRQWIKENCSRLYLRSSHPANYIPFSGSARELALPNYYQIFLEEEDVRLALALTSTPFGATRLNVILNTEGENKSLLSASLDLIATEEDHNTFLQSSAGMKQLNLQEEIGFNMEGTLISHIHDLADLMK